MKKIETFALKHLKLASLLLLVAGSLFLAGCESSGGSGSGGADHSSHQH